MTIIINSAQDSPVASLDDFMQGIRMYAPTVALPTAYVAIRQACIQFCERTRLWREEDAFNAISGEDVLIVPPMGAEVIDFDRVAFGTGEPLTPKTTGWLDANMYGWRTNEAPGTPRYVTQIAQNTLMLVPGASGSAKVSLWLKPSQDCIDVPAFLPRQHRETIAHGALARILAIPNQPYTDLQMAGTYLSLFTAKLESMATRGTTGQQRARVRSRAHMF